MPHRTLPGGPLTEDDWLEQVTQLAELHGWHWAHFRPARTKYGWRTPASGTIGKGWPDLVLVHEQRRRLIFAELKRDSTKPDADQDRVLGILSALTGAYIGGEHLRVVAIEVAVWRPRDFELVKATLE